VCGLERERERLKVCGLEREREVWVRERERESGRERQ
jgi:hypothetical protein